MKKIIARCGTYCHECEYKDKTNCPTCHGSDGMMFWGKCEIAECVIKKEIENCSECKDFPCDLLKSYSYDKEHGDNGKRIRNLKEI